MEYRRLRGSQLQHERSVLENKPVRHAAWTWYCNMLVSIVGSLKECCTIEHYHNPPETVLKQALAQTVKQNQQQLCASCCLCDTTHLLEHIKLIRSVMV